MLSPAVSQDVSQLEARDASTANARFQMAAQQIIKGIETGAIAPDQGKAALQKIGFGDLEVGPSPEAQARQAAVEREQGWMKAAQEAGGDPVKLASAAAVYRPELAVSLFNQQEARAARATEAQRNFELRQSKQEDDFNAKMRQLDIAEQQGGDKNEIARLRAEADSRHKTLLAQIAREGNQARILAEQNKATLLQMRMATQGAAANQQTVRRAGQLVGALEKAGLPSISASLDSVEAALQDPKVDVEKLTGPKSMLPDWAVSKEDRAARQALQQVFNIVLKERSGAAVTNQELERLKKEFGQGAFKTKDQIEGAITRLREVVTKHYKGIAAGFGTDALDFYNQNLEAIGGKPLITSGGASKYVEKRKTPDGRTLGRLSDGTIEEVIE